MYQGVPGELFGFSFSTLSRTTDISVDDLQPGTANRLREEGIRTDGLADADNLIKLYEAEIADRKQAEAQAAEEAAAAAADDGTAAADGAAADTAQQPEGGTDTESGASADASPDAGATDPSSPENGSAEPAASPQA